MINKLITIACAIFVTSCASYKAQTLSNLSPQSAPFSTETKGVTVSCKVFTVADCKRYLDRNVIAKGFQPVQISIENNTSRTFMFSQNAISVPCADPNYVASKVHTSTVGRATAYGVGALFIWPLAIPAIVDGVKSSNANEQLDNDFEGKMVKAQTLLPYTSQNGLIFVPVESFQDFFTLTLVDKETKEPLSFVVKTPRV